MADAPRRNSDAPRPRDREPEDRDRDDRDDRGYDDPRYESTYDDPRYDDDYADRDDADRPRRRRRPAADRREEHGVVYADRGAWGPAAIKRISWGAIFAGAVIALVTQLALNLLGASIGFGAIDPATEANPFSGLGTGTGIWLAVSTIIALLLGGFVASRLAGMPDRLDGILHGVVTWGLVTIVTLYLMTSAVGRVLNVATGIVGQGIQLAGQGIQAVAPGALDEVQQQLQQEGISVEELTDDLIDQLSQAVTPGAEAEVDDSELRQAIEQLSEPGSDAADRQAVVDLLVARTDMSEAEAQQTVQEYEQQFQQTRQQAQQVSQQVQQQAVQIGDTAAEVMSRAALWAFIAMVVGVIAAAIGGALGVPKDLRTAPAVRRE